MSVIAFDDPATWLASVEDALVDPDAYNARLREAGIECAYGDCSGLDNVFSRTELAQILGEIEARLARLSIRLYHGCRLQEGVDPQRTGLQPSSTDGIVKALLDLAARDPVLMPHRDAIAAIVADPFYQEQIGCREGQIWFCQTMREMTDEGGVYIAFGSEFRLLILNRVDESLKMRLLHYGRPAIVVVDLPIRDYFADYTDNIAKFLFARWKHHRLELSDAELPSGFSCYIKSPVPAEHVAGIIRADRVYDQYNSDSRWYAWHEIDQVAPQRP